MAQSGLVIGILIISFSFALLLERLLLGGIVRAMGRAHGGADRAEPGPPPAAATSPPDSPARRRSFPASAS